MHASYDLDTFPEARTIALPPPVELGRVDASVLRNLGELAKRFGWNDGRCLDGRIDEHGKAGFVRSYDDDPMVYWGEDGTDDTMDALRPVLDASGGWLPRGESLTFGFAYRDFQAGDGSRPGPWHTDGPLSQPDFRGTLLYDSEPTDFATGDLTIDQDEELEVPSVTHIKSLIFKGELELAPAVDPGIVIGLGNTHLHRVRAMKFGKASSRSMLVVRTLSVR